MKYFYCQLYKIEVSYEELIYDINNNKHFKFICNHQDYYKIFRDIIVSILSDKRIVLLDSEFSIEEIKKFNLSLDDFEKIEKGNYNDILNENDLIEKIQNRNDWELVLFTSGTTGTPKKFTHNLKTLCRKVKIDREKSNDVWGFAYNPTHIAGIQVFFQALLNLNQIVRLFQLPKEIIFKSIEYYNITNISATPTFFRLLLDKNRKIYSVKRITSGGERFDTKLFNEIKSLFVNAKVLNVYASTEFGTLFASENDTFIINEEIKSKIKILGNELYVKTDLVAKSDFLTNNSSDEWFNSGDLVEIVKEEPLTIKIIGRKNDFVNIGGYKVYINEVEEIINSLDGIKNSRVFAKDNSVTGKILVCEVSLLNTDIDEKTIFDFLSKRLQPYKIPRIIKIVDNIEITKTGKLKRI